MAGAGYEIDHSSCCHSGPPLSLSDSFSRQNVAIISLARRVRKAEIAVTRRPPRLVRLCCVCLYMLYCCIAVQAAASLSLQRGGSTSSV